MNVVTLGGVVLGTGILAHRAIVWWPGIKSLQKNHVYAVLPIAPFVFSWCYGALLVMCAGGLAGWAADMTVWGGSWAGDTALVVGVGGQAGDTAGVVRGPRQALTNGGHAVVLLLAFVWVAVKKRGHVDGSQMWLGTCSGVLLGLSTGVLGKAAIPLASLVNVAGSWLSTDVLS